MGEETGLVWDERYMWHDTGTGAGPNAAGGLVEPGEHVENPLPKRRFYNLLAVAGVLEQLVALKARPATREELSAVHTVEYIDRVARMSAEGGGDAGFHTPFGAGSFEIAALAAGGCMVAVDAVVGGRVRNAYALIRPPGHHALADSGMGFCLFNNVAVTARYAQAAHGLERIAIVDWDVHHGNGTQDAFYDDDRVLTISIHQDRAFPQVGGGIDERGVGAGAGCNVNVPLPPGSGAGAYLGAMERVVAPALRGHRPDLILVSSGLDANAQDPLGRMMLHSEAFRAMTRVVKTAAAEVCDGRLVACHEGGYSAAYVPFCGLAIVEELAGLPASGGDPSLELISAQYGHELQPHQDEVITAVAELVHAQWPRADGHERSGRRRGPGSSGY